VTDLDREPGPRTPRPAAAFTPWQLSEEDILELREHDLEIPEHANGWPIKPFQYVIVINQLRGYFPDQPRSLEEILESMARRTLDPEADREAEP
jgi:hypothetical protein